MSGTALRPQIQGLTWHDNGQSVLSGSALLLSLLAGGAFIGLIVWGFTQNNHSSSP